MTPGVAASVTSLGPNGFGGGHMRFNHCCSNPFFQTGQQSPIFFNGRHSHRNFVVGSLPFFSVPFTQVVVVQPDAGMDEDEDEKERIAIVTSEAVAPPFGLRRAAMP